MNIFIPCLVYRLICVACLKTAFAPDEFWQGPEIAHRIVFGYGHVTWEWTSGLRSFVHPILYASLYKLLQICCIDSSFMVFQGPRIIHAVLSALTDVHVRDISTILFGERVARWTLLCQLANWFTSYCMLRTYSSSVEAALTVVAIYYVLKALKYPPRIRKGNRDLLQVHKRWIVPAAISIVVRPPAALFWATVSMFVVVRSPKEARYGIMGIGICIGMVIMAADVCIDSFFYHRWVFTPLNFLKFNLVEGGSQMYGSNLWHWNFTAHLPSMLLSYIPFLFIGVSKATSEQRSLFYAAMVYLVVYSLPAHKEIRFLLPSLQLLIPYCGLGASILFNNWARIRGIVFSLFFTQFIAFIFFSLLHQRGQIAVMSEVRKALQKNPSTKTLFLTPCHATPYFSYVHQNATMRFFDCSPPGYGDQVNEANKIERSWITFPWSNISDKSEREEFEDNPNRVLSAILDSDAHPDIIISLSSSRPRISSTLLTHRFEIRTTFANCVSLQGHDNDCGIDFWHVADVDTRRA